MTVEASTGSDHTAVFYPSTRAVPVSGDETHQRAHHFTHLVDIRSLDQKRLTHIQIVLTPFPFAFISSERRDKTPVKSRIKLRAAAKTSCKNPVSLSWARNVLFGVLFGALYGEKRIGMRCRIFYIYNFQGTTKYRAHQVRFNL